MSDESAMRNKLANARMAQKGAETRGGDSDKAQGNNPIKNRINGVKSAKAQAKRALSFREKISKHWTILFWAGCFDLVGLIPWLCVVTNFGFAMILRLYFGSKKKAGDPSDFEGIVFPAFIANILDFILSIVPANIGITLVRIKMSKETEE